MAREADADAVVVGTPRLDLRPLALGDLDDLARLFADAQAMRHQCRVGDREDARRAIECSRRCFNEHGFGQLAVLERETGAFVGKCGFTSRIVEGHREFILSHLIDPAFEPRDYDREAFEAMLRHAFDELDFMRIVTLIKPGSRRLIRMVEQLGMESEREVSWEGQKFRLYVAHNW